MKYNHTTFEQELNCGGQEWAPQVVAIVSKIAKKKLGHFFWLFWVSGMKHL